MRLNIFWLALLLTVAVAGSEAVTAGMPRQGADPTWLRELPYDSGHRGSSRQGRSDLESIATRNYIAGQLPNRPPTWSIGFSIPRGTSGHSDARTGRDGSAVPGHCRLPLFPELGANYDHTS